MMACTTSVANATATCSAGACGFSCNAPYVESGGACEAPAPTQISPLSGTFVGTKLPTLTWANATGFTSAHLDVCLDHACDTILFSTDTTGTSATVTTALPDGIVFWRLFTTGSGGQSTVSSPVWEMELSGVAGSNDAPFTSWWGGVPDFDGDGVADFIAQSGSGGSSNLDVYPGGMSLGTPISIDAMGGSNANPGIADFNGDGYVDLALDAPPPSCGGCIAIYNGGPTGLSPNLTLDFPPPNRGLFGGFGTGDVNGDGFADLVVSTETAPDINGNTYVEVDAYYGSANGLSTVAVSSTTTVLSNGGFGNTGGIDTADVNGDGFADVLVALNTPGGPDSMASALVFYGSATGLGATPTPTTISAPSNGSPSSFVACAGDVNGDGYVDVALSTSDGIAIFEGGAGGIDTTSSALLAAGNSIGFNTGVLPLAAGDVNGDGYDDVIVPGTSAPDTFVYLGSSSGVGGSPFAFSPAPPSGYTTADGTVSAESALGDINGDGYADYSVAVDWTNSTSGNDYQTYIVFGASTLSSTPGITLSIGQVEAVR
jgi:hypothetical protein